MKWLSKGIRDNTLNPMDGHSMQNKRLIAHVLQAFTRPIREEKRLPFGWKAFAVTLGSETKRTMLFFTKVADKVQPATHPIALRLTVAMDVREVIKVRASLAVSGKELGVFDIRYAHVLQPFQLMIHPGMIPEVLQEGIRLEGTQGAEVWFFHDMENSPGISETHLPHLMISGNQNSMDEFLGRMLSQASLQPFGWMEGCVLDGLYDLWQATQNHQILVVIQQHLDRFWNTCGQLEYEDPHSRPVHDELYGIEGGLPFALLAKLHPEHESLDIFLEFCRKHCHLDGTIRDGDMVSAEGFYTIGYPLAVIARIREDRELIEWAVRQLEIRCDLLIQNGGFFLRHFMSDGRKTFRNWGRGAAWALLGLVRTLKEIQSHTNCSALEQKLSSAIQQVIGFQLPNGMWPCFLDEPETRVDCSATAGISAALAIAAKAGLGFGSTSLAAAKAYSELKKYLTPDGFLMGCAQSNKSGENLQREGYRVISPMATGLFLQLHANLNFA